MVVGDLAAVLEPRREGVNEREGRVRDRLSGIDGGINELVYFDQCLGDGGAVMVLKEVLIGYHFALGITNGDGGDDGSCVVF